MAYMSVVVPAYNSEGTITQCLKAIRQSAFSDYELIVVDDASNDATIEYARKYADTIIESTINVGAGKARCRGMEKASGEIIVCVDADVCIREDTFEKVVEYFKIHKDVDAITGILAKYTSQEGFFSQYKNLYMHYIFKSLPSQITFLYGSLFAVRSDVVPLCDVPFNWIVADTALGQKLFLSGKKISFLRDLEVDHLKKHDLLTIIKNDFLVPFWWAHIFVEYNGLTRVGNNKVAFAHSSQRQVLCIVIVGLIFSLFMLRFSYDVMLVLLPMLVSLWFILSVRFISYLICAKGLLFGLKAFLFTFIDNMIMGLGIACGMINILRKKLWRGRKYER